MLKISIPQPCHEDWSSMSPNEQGRHCNACAKTVVDFTVMSDDDVKNFFINKKEERVCGRFREKQLQQIVIDLPHNIFSIEMPLWKKFLVASLVVFSTTLFSCNTSIDGRLLQAGETLEQVLNVPAAISQGSAMMVGQTTIPDTTRHPSQTCTTGITMGIASPQPVRVIVPEPKQPAEPVYLKGDVAIIVPDTTKPIKCEPILMGKPSLTRIKKDIIVGELKIKNPPKAENGDCDKKSYQ